jgi:hypothetical protein
MGLVHEPRFQVLPDRGDAAAEPHVLTLGCITGACERFVDASGDTVKCRAAIPRQRGSLMVTSTAILPEKAWMAMSRAATPR